ncbi:glutamate--cysteine ligase [Sandaracinus amylolyticus]|uniref:Glutamate--cysteine ligase n=1 Tax=Sandaracinus amylolyticus TaxID=927083 RepID=A0A0F6W5Q8_9BACT|nr:glutamate--cysteine ligase [Sandaracinus amylolyticus]AKF08111.1 Glutamate--cysteine ligase [Sandaracinus amylolyticus]
MAVSSDSEQRPIRSLDDLLEPFHHACKPREAWRIGTEAEKHGVVLPDLTPIPFEGDRGIAEVLRRLANDAGWELVCEGATCIQLQRGDASITLEPGAQLELSGAPLATIHETAREHDEHLREVHAIGEALGLSWMGLGFHPFARREDLPWVPKLRYPIMREYLPTRGRLALDMMLRTCTVQANMDYASEADAMRKLRASLRVQPIASAMFANSPFLEGRITGERSRRVAVWLEVDPDRSGLLPFAWDEGATFRDYVEWALDVPMFLVKHEGRLIRNTGQTFRAFWQDGFEGARPNMGDWLTHLNTLFPEVRLKKTIETRGADSQRAELVPALAALWKGLLYDDGALAATESLGGRWTHDEIEAVRPAIARDGLRAKVAGREVGEWASELLGIAERGLRAQRALDEQGRDETIHLAPLRALIERGMTPADALLAQIDPKAPLAPQVVALTKL